MNQTDKFLQMTFVSSRTDDINGVLYRIETRRDDLTGLKLTRRSPVPALDLPMGRMTAKRQAHHL